MPTIMTVKFEANVAIDFNLTGFTYDSVSFNVSSQESNPMDLFFNPDGTTMYIIGIGSDAVREYTLSTGFDLSTASYSGNSFSTGLSAPRSIFIGNEGSTMYIVEDTADRIYEFALSTPWDITTASQTTFISTFNPRGAYFRNDGTRMFIAEAFGDVHQYTLSTPWDLSTASYDSVSFDPGVGGSEVGIFFSTTGNRMFYTDNSSNTVRQYTLSTPWDLSTASYDSINLNVSSQASNPGGVFINPDANKLFVVGYTTDSVFQYSKS